VLGLGLETQVLGLGLGLDGHGLGLDTSGLDSISESQHIYIEPYVGNKSEAHYGATLLCYGAL